MIVGVMVVSIALILAIGFAITFWGEYLFIGMMLVLIIFALYGTSMTIVDHFLSNRSKTHD
jgi:hypothetical protein